MTDITTLYTPIAKVDFDILKDLQEKGLITVKETNETEPEKLYICNYTEVCAFSRAWDQYTIQCRGLIIDKDGNIRARPFPKFFNFEEPEAIIPQDEDFIVSYKEDGSCGILYWVGGVPKISTRGSFNSDQAVKATELLNSKYADVIEKLDKEHTYIFEIIYPENRIVLDYGGLEDLILLGKIHTSSGKDVSANLDEGLFPTRKVFKNAGRNLSDLKEVKEENIEGFVVHFTKSNLRVKVKMEEYKRLHKIMTGLSEKGIWEMLRDKQDMDKYLQNVPDEFFNWFTEVKEGLEAKFRTIEAEAKKVLVELKALNYPDRKSQAIYITTHARDIAGIVFNMLDEAEYAYGIWGRIRPVAVDPFKKNKEI